MSEKKEKTIHARMAEIKKELSETKIAKSGHNKFAGFKYHELSDFIEIVNKLNQKHGVNDVVNIDKANNQCSLTLYNVDDSKDYLIVTTPYEEAEMLAKGGGASKVDKIQRMGSTITYNRRYLYMTAYNIQESDGVDSQEPVDEKPQPKKETKPAPKTISNENFAKGLAKVQSGEIFVFDLEDKLKGYTLTTEQKQQIEQLKENEKNK